MKKLIPVFAVSMILIFGATQSAFAGAPTNMFGDANIPPNIDDITSYNPNPPGEYTVTKTLSYNPSSGAWEKQFFSSVDNDPNFITEEITNGGPIPISDWHETIQHGSSVLWNKAFVEIYQCGTTTPLTNAIFDPFAGPGNEIWIDFNPPIQQGQCFKIVKPFVRNQAFAIDPVIIQQYPTAAPTPVGGSGLPIDSTALLLASAQSISLWMIPVIAGIGIGVFVINLRKN